MMRFVPFDLLRRLIGGGESPEPRMLFQVVAHGRIRGRASEEELESLAETIGDLLDDHAQDLALGPVVGYNLLKGEVEVEFTVEAPSAEAFHKKLSQISRLLEREDLMEYEDTTASRLHPDHEQDQEAVLA